MHLYTSCLKSLLFLFVLSFSCQFLSAQIFSLASSGAPFPNLNSGAVSFVDVDNDGDQDVLITGQDYDADRGRPGAVVGLYINTEGRFEKKTESTFVPVIFSHASFADVDKDGDQDVLIMGMSSSGPLTNLYINTGGGNFQVSAYSASIKDLHSGSVNFADIDADGDQDFLITGFGRTGDGTIGRTIELHLNMGQGNFRLQNDHPFTAILNGSAVFADIDRDGDQDVTIIGDKGGSSRPFMAKLFRNSGSGSYEAALSGAPFAEVTASSTVFVDVDGDEDLDLLVTGAKSDRSALTRLYINNGGGGFEPSLGSGIESVTNGSISTADVDNDGDQDVFISGYDGTVAFSSLYINAGGGTFLEAQNEPFLRVNDSASAFADIDRDGDQDLLVFGLDDDEVRRTRMYINNGRAPLVQTDGAMMNCTGGRNGAKATLLSRQGTTIKLRMDWDEWATFSGTALNIDNGNCVNCPRIGGIGGPPHGRQKIYTIEQITPGQPTIISWAYTNFCGMESITVE
ncbi:MAG: VCBS repeat-containing protein [Bacteroidota bacterium]